MRTDEKDEWDDENEDDYKKIMMKKKRKRRMEEDEDVTRWRRMRMKTQGRGPTRRPKEMMRRGWLQGCGEGYEDDNDDKDEEEEYGRRWRCHEGRVKGCREGWGSTRRMKEMRRKRMIKRMWRRGRGGLKKRRCHQGRGKGRGEGWGWNRED